MKQEIEEQLARERARLVEFQQDDEKEKSASREWNADISLSDSILGKYISYDGSEEFLAPHTASITCIPGHEPRMDFSYKIEAIPATLSLIHARSISGNIVEIRVSRHKADSLLRGLIEMWRKYR